MDDNLKAFARALLFLIALGLIAFIFFSCEKQERSDFDVHRDLSLKPVNCPKDWPPSKYDYRFTAYDQTDNEMLSDIKTNTFSAWIMPYDTIWAFRGKTDHGFVRIYFIFPDSVYEISTEKVGRYRCN